LTDKLIFGKPNTESYNHLMSNRGNKYSVILILKINKLVKIQSSKKLINKDMKSKKMLII